MLPLMPKDCNERKLDVGGEDINYVHNYLTNPLRQVRVSPKIAKAGTEHVN